MAPPDKRIPEPNHLGYLAILKAYRAAEAKQYVGNPDKYDGKSEMRTAIGANPKGPILELGCAAGGFTYALSWKFPTLRVMGVDIDAQLITTAKEFFQRDNLEYHCLDALDAHSVVNDSNLVIGLNFIHHIDDLTGLARSIFESLAPGGAFMFKDLVRRTINEVYHRQASEMYEEHGIEGINQFCSALSFQDPVAADALALSTLFSHWAAYTVKEVTNVLEENGFVSIRIIEDVESGVMNGGASKPK